MTLDYHQAVSYFLLLWHEASASCVSTDYIMGTDAEEIVALAEGVGVALIHDRTSSSLY